MELTQMTVNGLLAELGSGDGYLYLPGDIDPQEFTDLLDTLLLDGGVVDPAVDDSKGAALLHLFEGRAVTIRAWAYGSQWVGTGTARGDEGSERAVFAVTHREVPDAPALSPDEDVDWVDQLTRITGWTYPAERPDVDWAGLEARLGSRLPSDYKRMVETFGEGAFDAFLSLHQEPWIHLKDDGLLAWAGTEHEDQYCWRLDGDDPDRWPVVVRSFDGDDTTFGCRTAEFVCRILTDPHHPYTMARYFDTHWFMNYATSE
ncbi:hypothetical protein [Streptomyces sp. NPDC060194]|uniref:hypothetical protein n=1 Tax=Streptomyces sp. NPDC060194 TaxID=3347069 RepID=UPI00366082A2